MMPLFLSQSGEKVKVMRILGGCRFVTQMSDMGLREGTVWEVVNGNKHGGVILKSAELRLALGHNMAAKILVENS